MLDIDDMCVYILLFFYIVSAFLCEVNVYMYCCQRYDMFYVVNVG